MKKNGLMRETFKKQTAPIIFLMIGYTVVSAAGVFFALISKNVVDNAINGLVGDFIVSAVIMASLGVVQIGLNLICRYGEERIKLRLECDLRERFFREFLNKSYPSETRLHSGEVINRLGADVAVIADGAIGIVPHFVQFVVKIAMTFVVLFSLDWRFTVAVLAGAAVSFVIFRFFKLRIKKYHKGAQEAEGAVRADWQETLSALDVVKAFNAADTVAERSRGKIAKSFRARMKRVVMAIFSSSGIEFVFRAGSCFAVIWGGAMILGGAAGFTIGTLTAIIQLVGQINQPFTQLANLIPRYYQVSASAERVEELVSGENDPEYSAPLENGFGSLEFKDVTFSYGGDTVLERVNMRVEKGEFISIAGISGSGKTTVLRLLLSLYTNYEGRIDVLDGKGLPAPEGFLPRSLFSYVPQEPELFSGTVRENVAFGRSCSDEEIFAALDAAEAGFVRDLEKGLDTVLAERGGGLSEGQRQRLSVARALLYDAPILLLDEATSALDADTEKRLLTKLKSEGRTVVMVSHRPAALEMSERILKVKDKKIY